jgi:hypothetical protein
LEYVAQRPEDSPITRPRSPENPGNAAVSILAALAYADLFDYPLTLDELTEYQVGTNFSRSVLLNALTNDAKLLSLVMARDGFYSLRERSSLIDLRARRERYSRPIWRRAIRYCRWAARLPYVQMVAVTGALAVHNIGELPDIDLLVVARDGRVWLCRRALIILVRVARLLGDDLCPNYVLAESNLKLDQRDFFTAHELAQMVPTSGMAVYRRMLNANDWATAYLPRALGSQTLGEVPSRRGLLKRGVEGVLNMQALNRWERWELRRLREKLKPDIGEMAEVVCSPVQCKGHTGYHRQRVMARYGQRLAELGLDGSIPPVIRGDLEQIASYAVDG